MPAGRPLKFASPEELDDAVDAYFAARQEDGRPVTIMGLCVHLDMSRQSLLNYSHRDKFLDSVKKAKERVMAAVEELMFTPHSGVPPSASIFWLKANAGWQESQVIEVGEISISNQPVESEMTDDEWEEAE